MSQPQKGICAEPNLHAQYLLFNVVDEDLQEKLEEFELAYNEKGRVE